MVVNSARLVESTQVIRRSVHSSHCSTELSSVLRSLSEMSETFLPPEARRLDHLMPELDPPLQCHLAFRTLLLER